MYLLHFGVALHHATPPPPPVPSPMPLSTLLHRRAPPISMETPGPARKNLPTGRGATTSCLRPAQQIIVGFITMAAARVAAPRAMRPIALREMEQRRYTVQRGRLPEQLHVLRMGRSVLCNPTGLRDDKLCAVAFPSRELLVSVNRILGNSFDIREVSTDDLLDHVEHMSGVAGIFQIVDCSCRLADRKTFYEAKQIEADGRFVNVSEQLIVFDD
ncbi:hypothetical protein KFL_011760040 [Klebsormidium nitens]|uniref:Uncharacterized protein n=1 Tax=Klebsormidium nitens TaxID=105231 RepID=A0A1Y1IQ87_KLENI|nr:hypothetical protein KFL_011760040 [Klebsormidium nitens]|eukprot:GAQ92874.1 hypothetical protein KFL_011760040 [Klebsormidium nitens]